MTTTFFVLGFLAFALLVAWIIKQIRSSSTPDFLDDSAWWRDIE